MRTVSECESAQNAFSAGLHPDPTGELTALPQTDSLAGLRGPILLREGKSGKWSLLLRGLEGRDGAGEGNDLVPAVKSTINQSINLRLLAA